jgi:hypothetical protein
MRKPKFYRVVEDISEKCHPPDLDFSQPDLTWTMVKLLKLRLKLRCCFDEHHLVSMRGCQFCAVRASHERFQELLTILARCSVDIERALASLKQADAS